MNIIQLKYPAGKFTQAELAVFNGMEKLAVYLPLREAVASGSVVLAGTRPTGKRPANVYELASSQGQTATPQINAPVAVPALPVVQPSVDIPSVPETPPVVNNEIGVPVSQLSTRFDSILSSKPTPAPLVFSAPNPEFLCPLCNEPMSEATDSTGVMLKCFNSPCDPQCHENVYGHGKNAKEAWAVAKQKFQKQ